MKARELTAENVYERIDRRGKALLCAQQYFCEEAKKRGKKQEDPVQTRIFVPAQPVETEEAEEEEEE